MRFLKSLFSSMARVDDEPKEKQLEDYRQFPMEEFLQPECDELPNAYGEFGYSITNPIPVNGPIGEFVYLSRLCSPEVGFFFHRLGATNSPVCDQKIDHYELVSVDSKKWISLYFSMYHPRRSTKVPDGLALKSWSCIEPALQIAIKRGFMQGTNQRIENFPLGLPDTIRAERRADFISPGLTETLANTVQKTLDENKGKWIRH